MVVHILGKAVKGKARVAVSISIYISENYLYKQHLTNILFLFSTA